MNWIYLTSALLTGLFGALVGAYWLAHAPGAGIDRFSTIALALPLVWTLVCLHILLVRRPLELAAAYLGLAALGLAPAFLL